MIARASKPPAPGPRSISAGEVYPITEAARRLGWGRKTMARAQRDGLSTVQYGRQKYVTGAAVLEFFRRLETRPEE